MADIQYRLSDVLKAQLDLETRPEAKEMLERCSAHIIIETRHDAKDLLEQIKVNIEEGHRVLVPYPDGRGWWKLYLDGDRNLVWRCQEL